MSIRQAGTWAVMMAAIAALTWLVASAVEAHFIGADSVDGCEIRWEDETKYDTERVAAQNAWENLKGSDNCVDLEPDVWNTVADLQWKDVDKPNENWVGHWSENPLPAHADTIEMNSHYLDSDSYTSCKRKSVAIHELGHAHGLDHSYVPNLMDDLMSNYCTLGFHDISDYEELWGPQ